MYSFHATKVFNTIEGGCVCFKDDAWVQLLNDMKNFGIHGPESVQYIGGNAKMNEFQAAMGICNLRHLNDEIAKRKKVVERYRSRLEGVSKLNKLYLDVPDGAFMYPLYIENGSEIRRKLQIKKIFIPTLWPAVFNLCSEDELEYDMASNILPIPVDQRYGIEDMQYIIDAIKISQKE